MKALLCFHGLLSDSSDFDFIKMKLDNKYDYIYTPSLPGHGMNKDKFQSNQVLQFVIEAYDNLRKKYSTIDILGYSLGGILAIYVSQYRYLNRLILLAPALYFIDFKKYRPRYFSKDTMVLKEPFGFKTIDYFFVFTKIVRLVKKNLVEITPPICIIYGEDDIFVSNKSGVSIYQISTHPIKQYITLKDLNHISILTSVETQKCISDFLQVN